MFHANLSDDAKFNGRALAESIPQAHAPRGVRGVIATRPVPFASRAAQRAMRQTARAELAAFHAAPSADSVLAACDSRGARVRVARPSLLGKFAAWLRT